MSIKHLSRGDASRPGHRGIIAEEGKVWTLCDLLVPVDRVIVVAADDDREVPGWPCRSCVRRRAYDARIREVKP